SCRYFTPLAGKRKDVSLPTLFDGRPCLELPLTFASPGFISCGLMETVRRLIVALGTLAAGLGMLTAQEPARVAGHVLLLQSDRGLEGDIEKIGEQYRIR